MPVCQPRSTSHRHCARNASSMKAASICGLPKRSRVKNPLIERRRVFYHGGGRFGKLPPTRPPPAMDEPKLNQSTLKESTLNESKLDDHDRHEVVEGEVSSVSPVSPITSSGVPAAVDHALATPSHLDGWVQKVFIGPEWPPPRLAFCFLPDHFPGAAVLSACFYLLRLARHGRSLASDSSRTGACHYCNCCQRCHEPN